MFCKFSNTFWPFFSEETYSPFCHTELIPGFLGSAKFIFLFLVKVYLIITQ